MTKKPRLEVSTTVAMHLMSFDNQKFNEAVSQNYYQPRGEQPKPGKARQFGELDLIGLFIMKRLMIMGCSLGVAAGTAEHMVFMFETNPKLRALRFDDETGEIKYVAKGDKNSAPASPVFDRDEIVAYLQSKLDGKI